MPKPVVGIAWYRAQDYREILQIMVDGSSFPATYREWREEAELLERDLKRLGQEVVRAILDPEIFPLWCNSRGFQIDAKARREFTDEVARQRKGQDTG